MNNIFKTLALLFVVGMMVVGCEKPQQNQCGAAASDSCALGIAYINTDSLLLTYKLAQKLQEQIMAKEEAARADFNQKARTFQQDANEFQRKVQNNAFLSLDRAQKEQERLQKAEQDLQELNNRLSQELMNEQAKLSVQLHDTLQAFLKEYAVGRYQLIISNNMGDNVLYSAPGVDITNEVVEILNARYKE
ncbi:MAG: OmpH family outer membrane protein [Marinilabiliaceae bacterium]|nr:OmpH family outer membrane protein [Marinilabiliaceae bacterium]